MFDNTVYRLAAKKAPRVALLEGLNLFFYYNKHSVYLILSQDIHSKSKTISFRNYSVYGQLYTYIQLSFHLYLVYPCKNDNLKDETIDITLVHIIYVYFYLHACMTNMFIYIYNCHLKFFLNFQCLSGFYFTKNIPYIRTSLHNSFKFIYFCIIIMLICSGALIFLNIQVCFINTNFVYTFEKTVSTNVILK